MIPFVGKNIIEKLNDPIKVTNWNNKGLVAADGRIIPLPDMVALPTESAALAEVMKQGVVEIAPDGRIYGLVRIRHFCGNDIVRNHIARVDIAKMLLFLGEGEPKLSKRYVAQAGGRFTEYGWNLSDFMGFEEFLKYPIGEAPGMVAPESNNEGE